MVLSAIRRTVRTYRKYKTRCRLMREARPFHGVGCPNLVTASPTFDQPGCIRLLRHHIGSKSLLRAQFLHDHIIRCGYDPCPTIRRLLLQFYFRCGAFRDVIRLFESNLPYQDTSTLQWNLAIGSCIRQEEGTMAYERIQNKKFSEAMALFDRMYQESMSPDKVSFVNIITTLARGPIHIGMAC